jgi:predicted chitinase
MTQSLFIDQGFLDQSMFFAKAMHETRQLNSINSQLLRSAVCVIDT